MPAMRAWQVAELGEPIDVLQIAEIDDPVAGPEQVVVEVEAAGVCFPDVLLCRGGYQMKPPLPFVPGSEVAGRVVAVGDGVPPDVAVGTRVAGLALGLGGFAERALVAAFGALPIPDSLSAPAAAALPINYHTVWFSLRDRAALRPTETLLVHAAAGGVGSAAVQVGLALGARVIATAGGPEKVKVCEQLGADLVIDYTAGDFVDAVKEATGGAGADVIFDPVGGDVFDRSRKCIAWDGRLLVIGFAGGRIPEIPANHILLKNYSVVGVHWGASVARDPSSVRRTHDELMKLHESHGIDPLIFREVPFGDAPAAVQSLAERGTWGKVVIVP
jgi:NADPH2:quinone reductase